MVDGKGKMHEIQDAPECRYCQSIVLALTRETQELKHQQLADLDQRDDEDISSIWREMEQDRPLQHVGRLLMAPVGMQVGDKRVDRTGDTHGDEAEPEGMRFIVRRRKVGHPVQAQSYPCFAVLSDECQGDECALHQ